MGFESIGALPERKDSSRSQSVNRLSSGIRTPATRGAAVTGGSRARARAGVDSVGEFGRLRPGYHLRVFLRAGGACLRCHWAEVIWVSVSDFYANPCLAPWPGCWFGDTETLGPEGNKTPAWVSKMVALPLEQRVVGVCWTLAGRSLLLGGHYFSCQRFPCV